jgi:hypothetical protein
VKELLKALREGTAAEVREILLKDSRVVSRGGSWRPDGRHPDGGASLLWEAISSPRDRLEKLRVLAAAGADVNSTSLPKGTTLLNQALLAGDLELARVLISLGADVSKRDRRGLSPFAIAVLREDQGAQALLRAAGAEEPDAGPREAEQAFLLDRPLYAEIHETIKWAIRGAGLEIVRMRIPAPWGAEMAVLYWIPGWRIRLGVLELAGGCSLSLTLESESTGAPVADLLPPGESVSNSRLRGHLVTLLMGARSPGAFAAPGGASAGQGEPEAGGDAWALLGLRAGASAAEITRAYRKLAKLYHPDKAGPQSESKMKEVNRAYEEVARKKRS